MKIINVGPYPPPIGGVSQYVSRLNSILLNKNMDTVLIDISKQHSTGKNILNLSEFSMFLKLLFGQKKAIVHFHLFSLKLGFLYFILSLKHITIVTFHNERFYDLIRSKGKLIYILQKMFLNTINYLIVVNTKCEDLAKNFVKHPERLLLINNFIAPLEVPEMNNQEILGLRRKHRFIISSNAWKISYHMGQDLYGIDILIELMKNIVIEFDAVLIFVLPNTGDEEYFIKLSQTIKKYDLEERFIFIREPLESGSSLWQISDLVIRATNTDGSSLTVLEALCVGTPVLASDCVERPPGVVLFKTRDVNDLLSKTREILKDISGFKNKVKEYSANNDIKLLLNFYDDILKNNR